MGLNTVSIWICILCIVYNFNNILFISLYAKFYWVFHRKYNIVITLKLSPHLATDTLTLLTRFLIWRNTLVDEIRISLSIPFFFFLIHWRIFGSVISRFISRLQQGQLMWPQPHWKYYHPVNTQYTVTRRLMSLEKQHQMVWIIDFVNVRSYGSAFTWMGVIERRLWWFCEWSGGKISNVFDVLQKYLKWQPLTEY